MASVVGGEAVTKEGVTVAVVGAGHFNYNFDPPVRCAGIYRTETSPQGDASHKRHAKDSQKR
jgi:hypothetical protein